MRHLAFFIILLAITEPLLAYANKVVVVVPQQVRRSGPPSWRPTSLRYRKSSHGPEVHYQKYRHPHQSKKPVYINPPFPHGGDDFDQGHEHVNHVQVPYGKGISHAISFGKGYIPYEKIKDSLALVQHRYPVQQEEKANEQDIAPSSSGVEYSSTGPSHETPQPSMYYPDPESAFNAYSGKRNDLNKYYTSRSIEKDLSANSALDLSGGITKGSEQLLFQANVSPHPHGSILLPSGIPPATIGGSKEGIVLRDTVSLDAYQQKLQEMTKTWPQFFAGAVGGGYQNQQAGSFSTAGSPGSSFTGSATWPLNFAQPKQGYAVKEDNMEPAHDFRTMPIQTSPFQAISTPVNVALPALAQAIHG